MLICCRFLVFFFWGGNRVKMTCKFTDFIDDILLFGEVFYRKVKSTRMPCSTQYFWWHFFFVLVRWFYFVYLQKQNRKITSWSIKKWGKKMRLWFVERITWKSVSVQRESYRNMYSSSLSLSFSFCGLPPSTEVYSTNYQTNNKLNTQS